MTRLKHKYFKLSLGLLCVLTMCFACKENKHEDWSEARTKMEQKGQAYLMLSRQALSEKNFTTAREKVNLLRKECELALSAREEGILLMDSINLFEAEEQFRTACEDSTVASARESIEDLQQKICFYQRKLEHDKKSKEAGNQEINK